MDFLKRNRDIALFIIAAVGIAGAMGFAYLPRPPVSPSARGVPGAAFHVDASGAETAAQAEEGEWKAMTGTTLYANRTKAAYWIRFALAPNPDDDTRFIHINNASLEDFRVYFPGREPLQFGKKFPAASMGATTRLWNVRIPEDAKPGDAVYLRVKTDTLMLVPLSVLTAGDAVTVNTRDGVIFGIFFGLLFTVFVVNLFFWAMIRESMFATYLAYLAFLITYHLRVHGFLWLLPIPFPVLEIIMWVSLGGFGIFLMRFAQKFLDLKTRLPLMHRVVHVGIAFFALQTAFGVLQQVYLANQIAYVTGFIVPVMIIGCAAWLYYHGFKQARFYLLALCFLVVGTLVWSTSAWLEAYLPANYFLLIGTSIDSLLFTLAIFDMFKRELLEKDEHIALEKYYQNLSHTDPLTGLYNRHYLNDLIRRLESEEEIPPESAVIMLDLDNFKVVNDTFGHLVGDMFLTKLGAKIRNNIRKSDIACRYGGDEFLIFLPGATERTAVVVGETIRDSMLTDYVYSEQGEAIHVTVSVGVTSNHRDDSFDGLFLRADAALYQAKKTGRNRIAVL